MAEYEDDDDNWGCGAHHPHHHHCVSYEWWRVRRGELVIPELKFDFCSYLGARMTPIEAERTENINQLERKIIQF